MAAEKDIHLVLVLEIEKYPVLYNYTLAGYSRKSETERVWTKISNKTHLSVHDCKEKWRNIRSSFLRSLKTDGSKPKKPYYLKKHLKFIVPYVKRGNEFPKHGNNPSAEDSDSRSFEDTEEEQSTNAAIDDSDDLIRPEDFIQDQISSPATPENSQIQEGGRRRKKEVDVAMCEYLKMKIKSETGEFNQCKNQEQLMNHFFLSLLPEFNDMTEQQIRSFKIKVLQLIDEIKQGNQSSATSFK